MDKCVREVMHRGVVTCSVSASAETIAKIMIDNNVSALVVIDECFSACGVVSKTNLLGLYGEDLSLTIAEDIMSLELVTVSPDTLIHEAINVMLDHKIHQLVIVTEAGTQRRPVGIFTSRDVISLMAGKSGPQSEAQIRCSECLRKLLSIGLDDGD